VTSPNYNFLSTCLSQISLQVAEAKPLSKCHFGIDTEKIDEI